MNTSVQRELDRRKARGSNPSTVAEIKAALAKIGYRLDRSMDCSGLSRILTGDGAGESYPCITTGVSEIDTGLSAFNNDARRDTNFSILQHMRRNEELYAVVRGKILEV